MLHSFRHLHIDQCSTIYDLHTSVEYKAKVKSIGSKMDCNTISKVNNDNCIYRKWISFQLLQYTYLTFSPNVFPSPTLQAKKRTTEGANRKKRVMQICTLFFNLESTVGMNSRSRKEHTLIDQQFHSHLYSCRIHYLTE